MTPALYSDSMHIQNSITGLYKGSTVFSARQKTYLCMFSLFQGPTSPRSSSQPFFLNPPPRLSLDITSGILPSDFVTNILQIFI